MNHHTSQVRVVPLVHLRRIHQMMVAIIIIQIINVGLNIWRLQG